MAKNIQYTIRRNGDYVYRRRWPKDVMEYLSGLDAEARPHGKEHFTKALGTSDKDSAERRIAATVAQEYLAAVDHYRRQIDKQPRALSIAEAMTIVGQWYRRAHADMDSKYRAQRLTEQERQERLEEWQAYAGGAGPYEAGDAKSADELAKDILAGLGIKAIPGTEEYNTFVNLIEDGVSELARQGNRLHHLQSYEGPADPLLRAALDHDERGRPRRTVADLIEGHEKAKAGRWGPRTKEDFKPAQRLLREALGASRALDSIKHEDGDRLLDLASRLPKNMSKEKALDGLTMPEAIEKGQTLGLDTVAPKTVNANYMAKMSAIFGWGVSRGWIDLNPVAKLSVPDPTADAERRDPFTIDQLKVLFAAAPWSDPEAAQGEHPARYWTPLLSLYHGLRRAEVCGLLVDDIVEREGQPFMLIRPNNLRGLKTKAAKRDMPIHPEMIRLDFLRYVATQRDAGADQLFPDALAKKRGQMGYNVGIWFNGLVNGLGFDGRNLSFHSFRHSFEDRLREADLHLTPVGQYLAGRATGGGTSSTYGAGFSTSKLVEAIGRVEYPGLRIIRK